MYKTMIKGNELLSFYVVCVILASIHVLLDHSIHRMNHILLLKCNYMLYKYVCSFNLYFYQTLK